jgi:hypothetical protein
VSHQSKSLQLFSLVHSLWRLIQPHHDPVLLSLAAPAWFLLQNYFLKDPWRRCRSRPMMPLAGRSSRASREWGEMCGLIWIVVWGAAVPLHAIDDPGALLRHRAPLLSAILRRNTLTKIRLPPPRIRHLRLHSWASAWTVVGMGKWNSIIGCKVTALFLPPLLFIYVCHHIFLGLAFYDLAFGRPHCFVSWLWVLLLRAEWNRVPNINVLHSLLVEKLVGNFYLLDVYICIL